MCFGIFASRPRPSWINIISRNISSLRRAAKSFCKFAQTGNLFCINFQWPHNRLGSLKSDFWRFYAFKSLTREKSSHEVLTPLPTCIIACCTLDNAILQEGDFKNFNNFFFFFVFVFFFQFILFLFFSQLWFSMLLCYLVALTRTLGCACICINIKM